LIEHVVIELQVGELLQCHIAALVLYSHLACPRQDMDHVWLKFEPLNPIHHSCTVVWRIKEQNTPVPTGKEHYLSQRRVHGALTDSGCDREQKIAVKSTTFQPAWTNVIALVTSETEGIIFRHYSN
jgi:hypothetical protein